MQGLLPFQLKRILLRYTSISRVFTANDSSTLTHIERILITVTLIPHINSTALEC